MKKQRTVRKHHNSGTVILTIILIAVLGFATYWVATNYETVKATFNGTKLYTQKEVTDAYNKGVGDKTSYEKQIADWMTKYETANASVKELTIQLEDYKKTNAEDKAMIEEMEEIITKLNGDIAYYKALIEQYKDLNKRIVLFYNGDEIVKSYAVDKDTAVTDVPTITDTDYIKFKGWSIDGTNVIDPTTITVSDDVKFVAVFEYYAKVRFMIDYTEYAKYFVKLNDTATLPDNPVKQYYNFKGWSIDGTNLVENLNTIKVTEDVTYYAIFEYDYTLPTLDKLNFALNTDKASYSVSAKEEEINGIVVIPTTYNNLPVTAISNSAFYDCKKLTEIIIPDSITSIGLKAFYDCVELVEIAIPKGVTSINLQTFSGCTSLTSVTIPDSVTSIDNGAFSYCTSLTNVTIPKNVEWLSVAFNNCTNLASVTIQSTNPPLSGGDSFKNCANNLIIYVPAESVNSYKASWENLADKIQSIKE